MGIVIVTDSAAVWQDAAQIVADQALEAQKRDQDELAQALRVLAVAGWQMSDAINENKNHRT